MKKGRFLFWPARLLGCGKIPPGWTLKNQRRQYMIQKNRFPIPGFINLIYGGLR